MICGGFLFPNDENLYNWLQAATSRVPMLIGGTKLLIINLVNLILSALPLALRASYCRTLRAKGKNPLVPNTFTSMVTTTSKSVIITLVGNASKRICLGAKLCASGCLHIDLYNKLLCNNNCFICTFICTLICYNSFIHLTLTINIFIYFILLMLLCANTTHIIVVHDFISQYGASGNIPLLSFGVIHGRSCVLFVKYLLYFVLTKSLYLFVQSADGDYLLRLYDFKKDRWKLTFCYHYSIIYYSIIIGRPVASASLLNILNVFFYLFSLATLWPLYLCILS